MVSVRIEMQYTPGGVTSGATEVEQVCTKSMLKFELQRHGVCARICPCQVRGCLCPTRVVCLCTNPQTSLLSLPTSYQLGCSRHTQLVPFSWLYPCIANRERSSLTSPPIVCAVSALKGWEKHRKRKKEPRLALGNQIHIRCLKKTTMQMA